MQKRYEKPITLVEVVLYAFGFLAIVVCILGMVKIG